MSAVRKTLAFAVFCAAFCLARGAQAEPQWHLGVSGGGGVRDLRDTPRGLFHLGVNADVLFARTSPRSIGLGPYLHLGTASFQSFEFGGGASLLLPAGGPVFVLSAGPHGRITRGAFEASASGKVFFGSRSYNYHGRYSPAIGGFVEGRYGLSGRQAEVFAGLELDTHLLAIPILWLINVWR